jgi:hypothetical protein
VIEHLAVLDTETVNVAYEPALTGDVTWTSRTEDDEATAEPAITLATTSPTTAPRNLRCILFPSSLTTGRIVTPREDELKGL